MITAGIVTVSDTRSRGERADTTTALMTRRLAAAGIHVARTELVPDDVTRIRDILADMADHRQLQCVLTTGGTGCGPRDVTPEATDLVIDRVMPGIPEAMRSRTAQRNPWAWLSRGTAGLRGHTLIVNLPGNPQGVDECLDVLLPLLPHAVAMLAGEPHQVRHAEP